jgi:hypothetical protein
MNHIREAHRPKVFGRRVLRGMYLKEASTRGWRKLYN